MKARLLLIATLSLCPALLACCQAFGQDSPPDISRTAAMMPEVDVVEKLDQAQYGARRAFYGGISFDFRARGLA